MIGIYARQSVDKKDSLSIEGQIELCRKYVDDEVLIFKDKGYSGRNINRPAFKKLLLAIEGGRIKRLFCYRLDRISRSISDFGRIWEIFEKYGVRFYSVTENFDTGTPMGRAMLNIVMTFAQLERETTAERVKDNYLHRFSLGAWTGGPAPYGFRLNKIKGKNGEKISSLLKDNEQSENIQKIYEGYAKDGVSLRSLAKELTAEGICGPKREVWDNVTLSRILRNPVYVKATEDVFWHYVGLGVNIENDMADFDGTCACNIMGSRERAKNKYNSFENQRLVVANHEGIIEADLWIKVQEKLLSNRQILRKSAGKYSWLTGIMKCAYCGYSVKIRNDKTKKKFHLICSGRSNLSICNNKIITDVGEIENATEREIEKILESCELSESVDVTAEEAEALLNIERKINRLLCALAESGEVSASYILKQIEALHEERKEIKNTQRKPIKRGRIKFGELSFEEKKLVAGEFIEKIMLKEESAEIIWRV